MQSLDDRVLLHAMISSNHALRDPVILVKQAACHICDDDDPAMLHDV